jgi:hypothetical protein
LLEELAEENDSSIACSMNVQGYVWVGLYLFPSLHPPSLDPQSRPKTGYQGKGGIRMEKK